MSEHRGSGWQLAGRARARVVEDWGLAWLRSGADPKAGYILIQWQRQRTDEGVAAGQRHRGGRQG